MNVAQCQAVLVRLADHFPFWGAKLSDERIANLAEDWAMVLADLEPREVSAALATLLSQKREFPPGVGEVNEAARGLIAKAQGEIEIAAAEGVEPSDFDHSATLRDLRLVLWRELGPGGAAVGTLAERLQDDAAARLRTRLRALLAEVVGEGDSRHNVSGGDGDSPA